MHDAPKQVLHPADAVLGFVGTGTITSAIVTGLCSDEAATFRILLSPRNAETAAELALRFRQVVVAESNQDVIDASDAVILAIRPQLAEEVLVPLAFRAEQRVISLIATFSAEKVASLVKPARAVTCAVPQPTVAARMSPTAIYPPDPFAAELFNRLGVTFEAATESDFRALFATTAAMASFFTLLDTLVLWLTTRGVSAATAHDYIVRMFYGLADVPQGSTLPLSAIAAEFKTQGGLNEQFARDLQEGGMFAAWSSALDAILARIVGSANHVE